MALHSYPLVFIQPNTLERVLSGICYKIQWLFASAVHRGRECYFYEDVSIYDADRIFARHGEAPQYILDVSTYSQVDTARQIVREFEDRHDICGVGLDELVADLDLMLHPSEGLEAIQAALNLDMLEGAFHFDEAYPRLMERANTDYDAHIRLVDDGKQWRPAFFSVGCDRKCPYCYVGYTSFPRGHISIDRAREVVQLAKVGGYNLHFYDEDFFAHPQIGDLLGILHGSGVKWICLTTSVTLGAAIRKFGAAYLVEAGNVLNEVGIETTDERVLEKKQDLQTIIQAPGINIFWLTVTFFPGETIASKNATGRFLFHHGYSYHEVLPRMRCNSTHGGLGQFFVPYLGTPWCERAMTDGRKISGPPSRLWPSYVPQSFYDSVPTLVNKEPFSRDSLADDFWLWMSLYYGVRDAALEILSAVDGVRTVGEIVGDDPTGSRVIAMAQLAQLGALW